MSIAREQAVRRGWFAPFRSPWARYGGAVLAVVFSTATQLVVRRWATPAPFVAACGAIAFSSWFCGAVPSLAAIALAEIAAAIFFLPALARAGVSPVVSLTSFTAVSLFIVVLGRWARKALRSLHELSSQLQHSEERWRQLAEAIPQIVWTADAGGKVDYANRQWLDYVGQTIDQARSMGWPNTVHADDIDAVLGRWKEATRTGTPYEVESRLKRGSDGVFRWFLSRGQPVRDDNGRIVRWFGTSTDIDDQKRAEGRSRFLAGASRELASSLDYEATLQNVARAAVPHFADWAVIDLLGDGGRVQRVAAAHADPRKAELCFELARRFPLKLDAESGMAEVLRTGRAKLFGKISEEQMARANPDPEQRRIILDLRLESSIIAPIVARGKTLGVITFLTAESHRRYSEEDLAVAEELGRRAGAALDNARLYRDLQEANRLKEEFVSTLSHELRTPLTAILGWTHVLRGPSPAPERVQRGIAVIERNARAQAQLIDDLLDLSRIVTGKMRLSLRELRAGEVIESALETVRPSAEAKGLRLSASLDAGAATVLGDPDRLRQVVWNLLSNAVKFTPRGGSVRVLLRQARSQAEIAVADDGQGIAESFLPHVFERFAQADSGASRAHGGLGLGLAIARHLTELHGGTIEAQSDGEGKGATFTVRIPLAREADPAIASGPALPAQAAASLEGALVLAVDDAADARDLLVEVLAAAGARVEAVAGAADALAALSRAVPDLLVSDIGMPGTDGYALIREVRKRHPALPSVALTAYARGEDRAKALAEGFDIHLPKPIDPAELVGIASALLRRRARR